MTARKNRRLIPAPCFVESMEIRQCLSATTMAAMAPNAISESSPSDESIEIVSPDDSLITNRLGAANIFRLEIPEPNWNAQLPDPEANVQPIVLADTNFAWTRWFNLSAGTKTLPEKGDVVSLDDGSTFLFETETSGVLTRTDGTTSRFVDIDFNYGNQGWYTPTGRSVTMMLSSYHGKWGNGIGVYNQNIGNGFVEVFFGGRVVENEESDSKPYVAAQNDVPNNDSFLLPSVKNSTRESRKQHEEPPESSDTIGGNAEWNMDDAGEGTNEVFCILDTEEVIPVEGALSRQLIDENSPEDHQVLTSLPLSLDSNPFVAPADNSLDLYFSALGSNGMQFHEMQGEKLFPGML